MNKFRLLFVVLSIAVSVVIVIKKPLTLGLDLQGGMQLILEAKDTEKVVVNQESITGAIEVIRNRIDGLGLSEPIIGQKR